MKDRGKGAGEVVVLHVPVLIYREEVAPRRVMWFARSILTSDLAFGDSRQEAIECVQETLSTSMTAAAARGMGPLEWLETQRPDEPKWIEQWITLWEPEGKGKTIRFKAADCDFEARIAQRDAA